MSYIVGAYSQIASGTLNKVYEHILNTTIHPLLTEVYSRDNVELQLYLGGAVLQWLDSNDKSGADLAIKDLCKNKKIELLTGSYYQSILPLVPPSDRVSQIEKTTNLISRKYKFLPKTFWCYGEIWDPSLINCLSLSKIERVIISLDNKETFNNKNTKPFKMQELGKSVDIIPIDTRVSKLIHDFGLQKISFDKMFSEIKKLDDNNVKVVMINLNQLCQGQITRNQVSTLFKYFFDNSENSLENLYDKEQLKLDYLNQGWYGFDALVSKKSIHGELCQDKSLNFLYSRILSLIETAKLYKKNRDIKKEIAKIIPKLLSGAPYIYDSNASILKGSIRSDIYKHIIELEKLLISLNDFNYFFIQDVDKDGIKEFISGGKNFNAIIDSKGGSLLELKYFPAKYNYVNSLLPYNIKNNNDNLAIPGSKQKLFRDVILENDFELSSYSMKNNKLKEINYIVENDDNKFTSFNLSSLEKQSLGLHFYKKYKFSSNELTLNIKIKNTTLKTKEFKYAVEMPLSFFPFKNNVKIFLNDIEAINEELITFNDVNTIKIKDKKHKTNLLFNFDIAANLYYNNSYINSLTVLGDEKIYQFSLFMPSWKLILKSKEEKEINITFRIGRNV